MTVVATNDLPQIREDMERRIVLALGPDWGEAVKSDWQQALPDIRVEVAPATVLTHSTTDMISKIR